MNTLPNPTTKHQDDFISIVCHELKTPLTLLSAHVQILNKKLEAVDDSIVGSSLAKAEEQIRKIGKLINGFLNASFLESGVIDIHKSDFKLNHLIGEVVQETRGLVKNQFIITDCDAPIIVNADRDKIACVLSNLICNAIKYSPEGKCIYVQCFHSPNQAIVRVRDEGAGIKPENLDRLFERFFRADCKEIKKEEGFGIGLYLSSAIIQQHGGNIWAESEFGNGATFYFSLPLS